MPFKMIIRVDGDRFYIDYDSTRQCLEDTCLRKWFDDGIVDHCSVLRKNTVFFSIPKELASWERFQECANTHRKSMDKEGK